MKIFFCSRGMIERMNKNNLGETEVTKTEKKKK
jgi:hypothetical protein